MTVVSMSMFLPVLQNQGLSYITWIKYLLCYKLWWCVSSSLFLLSCFRNKLSHLVAVIFLCLYLPYLILSWICCLLPFVDVCWCAFFVFWISLLPYFVSWLDLDVKNPFKSLFHHQNRWKLFHSVTTSFFCIQKKLGRKCPATLINTNLFYTVL